MKTEIIQTLVQSQRMPWRDFLALTKPRITLMVLFTSSAGIWLAPVSMPLGTFLAAVVGVVLAVGGVNALNMYLERDVDAFMERTRGRPLPAGRLSPRWAFVFGASLAFVGVFMVTFLVNLLSGVLLLMGVVTYLFLYTPMKKLSPWALTVGAVPGALPPLIGWTAATGTIGLPGLVLFGIIFLWQVPHFHAIALFRKEDYAQAGFRTLPVVKGDLAARRHSVFYILLLVPVSLLLVPLGVAGWIYGLTALVAGLVFLGYGLVGWRRQVSARWARTQFTISLFYLTAIYATLFI